MGLLDFFRAGSLMCKPCMKHDTQFNIVIVTVPIEVALDLTLWKQAASYNSECPWVYKALWSPYSRMRATWGGVPSLDT